MGIAFAIQYTDDSDAVNTVNFYDFADGNGRSFVDSIPSGNIQDNKRFSIPGVDGNFLIRSGFRGLQVSLKVRYRGSLSDASAAWESDREAFAKYNCALGDAVKFTYNRTTLRSNASSRITEELASGASGLVWFDVLYIFDVEEL